MTSPDAPLAGAAGGVIFARQMGRSLRYHFVRAAVRVIRNQCVREFVLNRHRLRRTGGFVIACTHVGNLEPALISCHTPRHITWLARVEFFKVVWLAPLLRLAEALPINRQGASVRTIRHSIAIAREGGIVGIFPEGGVVTGAQSMFRGGPMKRGACVIAIRAGVPILPCVVLGTEHLNRVPPWLPAKRARVWVAYGNVVDPPAGGLHRRAARFEMAERLQREMIQTHRELVARAGSHRGFSRFAGEAVNGGVT